MKRNKVSDSWEVSHKEPLYSLPIEERHLLDTADNMELITKEVHRAMYIICGDAYYQFLPAEFR